MYAQVQLKGVKGGWLSWRYEKRALISASAAEVTTCLRALHSTDSGEIGGYPDGSGRRSVQ